MGVLKPAILLVDGTAGGALDPIVLKCCGGCGLGRIGRVLGGMRL